MWVELHGAGRDVEVAGVFIMGVEEELVRWARVYSAVVEQPPPKMAAQDAESAGAAEATLSMQEEAEALRRIVAAGRPPEPEVEVAVASADEPVDDDTRFAAPVAVDDASAGPDVAASEADAPGIAAATLGDDEDEGDVGRRPTRTSRRRRRGRRRRRRRRRRRGPTRTTRTTTTPTRTTRTTTTRTTPACGDDNVEAGSDDDVVVMSPVVVPVVGADDGDWPEPPPAEPDLPSPYADNDTFWSGGEVHDLVGGATREWRPDGNEGLGGDEDAQVVELSDRRGESGDADSDDVGRPARRRGGRRRR